MYAIGETVVVNDRMQRNYSYRIDAPAGEEFLPGFMPYFTPAEILAMGVFEGRYCNDCQGEIPGDWLSKARIGDRPNPALNYFGVKSRKPLSYWNAKGWIIGPDPRGWFQWYCRYYMGRRLPAHRAGRRRGFTALATGTDRSV